MSLFSFFTTVTVADQPPEALLTGNSDVDFSSLPSPGFSDAIRLTIIPYQIPTTLKWSLVWSSRLVPYILELIPFTVDSALQSRVV